MSPSNDVQQGSNINYTIHLENFDPSETVYVDNQAAHFLSSNVQVDHDGKYQSDPISTQFISLVMAFLNKTSAHLVFTGQKSGKVAEFTMNLV